MSINSIIIDDEPLAREGIADYISRIPFISLVGSYANPAEAMAAQKMKEIELVFLDIQMPVITGLDFLSSLAAPPLVIIITAFPEYAVKGYELNVLDYLLKPVSFDRLLKACSKAGDYLLLKKGSSEQQADYIFIKTDLRYEKLMLNDILFVEGLQNYVTIHTGAQKFVTHTTLKYLEEILPSEKFIRTHKSYIAALRHIDNIDGNMLSIRGRQVPISRDNKEQIIQRILNGRLLKG